jgi:hypothetical protein
MTPERRNRMLAAIFARCWWVSPQCQWTGWTLMTASRDPVSWELFRGLAVHVYLPLPRCRTVWHATIYCRGPVSLNSGSVATGWMIQAFCLLCYNHMAMPYNPQGISHQASVCKSFKNGSTSSHLYLCTNSQLQAARPKETRNNSEKTAFGETVTTRNTNHNNTSCEQMTFKQCFLLHTKTRWGTFWADNIEHLISIEVTISELQLSYDITG